MSGIGIFVCGDFGDAATLIDVDLVGVSGFDFAVKVLVEFLAGDCFSAFESMSFNCATNDFGEYKVLSTLLTENLFKFVFGLSGAALALLVGVDFVVNDEDNGVVLIDGEMVGDNRGSDVNTGAEDFLAANVLEFVGDLFWAVV